MDKAPGRGKGYSDATNGGGGAFGGRGKDSDSAYSLTYGSADIANHLLGGSGAGGGDSYPRGAGGGSGRALCPWRWCTHHKWKYQGKRWGRIP